MYVCAQVRPLGRLRWTDSGAGDKRFPAAGRPESWPDGEEQKWRSAYSNVFCIFIFKNTFLPLEHARIRGPVSPLQGFTVFLTIYCTASISTLEWAPIQVRPNCLTSVILWKLVFPTWFSYSVVFFWNFSFFGNKGGSGTFIKQNIFDSHYFRSVAFSFYIFYY